jgi:hypothetical protein
MKRLFTMFGLLTLIAAMSAKVPDECSRTAKMQIYSSAFIHEETGDVLGYELAVTSHDDSTVDALFYVYEGAPNGEAIPLSGHLTGKRLSIQGNWVEHLVEYPSKKKIIETHFVKIDGTLDSTWFRGHLAIEGTVEQGLIRLKHVKKVWLCKV